MRFGGISGGLVQRYAEVDVDLPAGHTDLLHDEPDETLALLEIEVIDLLRHPASKLIHSPSESVVGS